MVKPFSFLGFLGEYALPVTQAVYFVVTFAVVYVVGRAVISPLLDRALSRSELDDHAKRPIKRLVIVVLLLVAVAAGFGAAGLQNFLASLSTIAAAGTLAIGFAMQDVIANFVAGVFIYTDRPFRIGDWIVWDESEGIVEDISLRVTRVRTFDNELLTVPNSLLTDGVIKNPVANDKLRIQFEFGIGYENDIQAATDIIVEEAKQLDDILDDPAPSVHLTELADSYVELTARVWIPDPSRADYISTRGEYVTNVKHAFDTHGIDIPYPHMDLSGGVKLANSTIPVAKANE